jgi:acyl-CoA synthetase (AMP-forming)/AMP-acid ligase II
MTMYRPILETFAAHARDSDPEWYFPVEGRTLRASELLTRSSGAAAVLAGVGVQAGSLLGLSMDNTSDFIVAALAAWRLGAALVPLRPLRGTLEDIAAFLDRIDRRSPLAALAFDGSGEAAALERWSAHSGRPLLPVAALNSASGLPAPERAAPALPDSTALVQYSSGSTGHPKGVIVTHGMLVAQAEQIESGFRAGTGNRLRSLATWMPLYHDAGLFTGLMLPLILGCRSLLASPRYFVATPRRWFQLAAKHEVDLLVSTNAAMVLALRHLEKRASGELDLHRLHLYLSAEKVSPHVLRRTHAWLAKCGAAPSQLHVPFGMAENTLGATCSYGHDPITAWFSIDATGKVSPEAGAVPGAIELVSCGRAHAGVSLEIQDDDARPLPELQLGELTIAGPCVMPGYLNDPEATAIALRGGRLHTNDLGFLHQHEFWYVARKDDLIVVDGRNIVPDDIEHTAESLGPLRPGSTALIAIEHEDRPQLHLLVEEPPSANEVERTECQRALRERVLTAHELLLSVSFCTRGSIEKTSSGKKRRKLIRERFAAGRLQLCADTAPVRAAVGGVS